MELGVCLQTYIRYTTLFIPNHYIAKAAWNYTSNNSSRSLDTPDEDIMAVGP